MSDTHIVPVPVLSTNKKSERPFSSGHWYDRDGNLVQVVPGATKGKQVSPTLTHARKLQLAAGQSSIRRMEAAPALEKWKAMQAVQSALTLPRQPEWTEQEYLDAIIEDSEQLAKKAAERGTEIHTQVENDLLLGIWGNPWVEAIMAQLARLTGGEDRREEWRCEVPGVHPYGYGTTVDLHFHGMVDGQLRTFVVDLKGKDPKRNETLADQRIYPDHMMQLAASTKVLDWSLDSTVTHIMWFDRQKPDALLSEPITGGLLKHGWNRFLCCLLLWQHSRSGGFYRPSWATPIRELAV